LLFRREHATPPGISLCAATFHAQIDRNSRENSQMPVKPQDVQANGMRS
jgi:hypothetical protein